MLYFFYKNIFETGFIFFPLFLLGIIGWIIIFDIIYLYLNKSNLPQIKEKILDNLLEEKKATRTIKTEQEINELKQKRINFFFSNYSKNLKTVKIITATAPLLGLLGTVNGMIKTFELISLYGNGNPIFIAEGISQALLTTQAGITIAFPLLLASNICQILIFRKKKLLMKQVLIQV